MKKTYIVATLLALLIVMLTTITSVQATTLLIPGVGNVWQFQPIGYSGKDITSIQAYYYTEANPSTPVLIVPMNVIYTKNLVTLVFSISSLPTENVIKTGVLVYENGVQIDTATGPGFVYRFH